MTHQSDRPRPIRKLRPEQRHLIRPVGCDSEPPEGLLRGIEQFNRGEYWECHETLEDLWKDEPGDIRYLYQGILLVAVGLLHLQRGNRHGAVAKLTSGIELLAPFVPRCMGMDTGGLVVAAGELLSVVQARSTMPGSEVEPIVTSPLYLKLGG